MYPDPSLFGRTGYREKDGDGEVFTIDRWKSKRGSISKSSNSASSGTLSFVFLQLISALGNQAMPAKGRSKIFLDIADALEANEKVIVHENEADVAVAQDAGYETSLISRLALKPGKVSHNLINYTEVPGYKKLYRNGHCLIISQKWSLSD
ncbi:hypothetical protein LXL04_025883 [Taraxacum kok-saghyz]